MTHPEQCCALVPGSPNPRRCTADGFQGWHYCRDHLIEVPCVIDTGLFVIEVDDQSPIRMSAG